MAIGDFRSGSTFPRIASLHPEIAGHDGLAANLPSPETPFSQPGSGEEQDSRGRKLQERSLRLHLRDATAEAHERLHHHPAFAALADGTIMPSAYRLLIQRLYGLHAALEAAADLDTSRSSALALDLAALGASEADMAKIPLCRAPMSFKTSAARLGLRYVVEGSAMGGQAMARSLKSSPHLELRDACSFFSGGGGNAAAIGWRAFLAELDCALPEVEQDIVAAANSTFAIFEHWLAGWDKTSRD